MCMCQCLYTFKTQFRYVWGPSVLLHMIVSQLSRLPSTLPCVLISRRINRKEGVIRIVF